MDGYTRFRSKIYSPQYAAVEYEKYFPISCSNRTWSSEAAYSGSSWYHHVKYIDDTVTPHYRQARKAGFLPTNPLRISEEDYHIIGTSDITLTTVADTCSSPAIKHITHDYGSCFAKELAPLTPPAKGDTLTSQEMASLLDEIWTRCQAERQKGSANLVESLAEVDKTFKMVGTPLENVVTFLKNFRANGKRLKSYKKVRADSLEMIRFVSTEWLRFRYGIMPLVNDVRAGMKALKKDYQPEPRIFTAREKGTAEVSSTLSGRITYTGLLYVDWIRDSYHRYDVRAGIHDKYTANAWNDLGLTFHNVIGVAWELTHYSFVVDWFVNIGDLIYANIPRVGVTQVGQFLTSKSTIVNKWSPVSTVLTSSAYTISGAYTDQIYMLDSQILRRNGGNGTSLVVKSNFRFDVFNRCADAAALTEQLLRSIHFG